jgi:hypothetical protein
VDQKWNTERLAATEGKTAAAGSHIGAYDLGDATGDERM